MIFAKIDTSKFDRALDNYIRKTGPEKAAQVISFQARKLVERMIAMTPPRSLAQGQTRVEKDIRKIIAGKEDGHLRFLYAKFGPRIQSQVLKNKKGEDYLLQNVTLDPSGATMRDHHARQRTGSRRRVKRKGDKLWVPYGKLESYIAQRKKNVGMARAGFLRAAQGLGAKVPAWVSRHNLGGMSGFDDNRLDREHPSVTITNAAPSIGSFPFDRLQSALNSRARDMQKHLQMIVQKGTTLFK